MRKLLTIALAALLIPATAFAQSALPTGTARAHINSNATTTIKAAPGTLYQVCVNSKGASANVATIYDNTAGSGNVIGVVDTTSQVICLTYNTSFVVGLTVVTATGTAADITVTYR